MSSSPRRSAPSLDARPTAARASWALKMELQFEAPADVSSASAFLCSRDPFQIFGRTSNHAIPCFDLDGLSALGLRRACGCRLGGHFGGHRGQGGRQDCGRCGRCCHSGQKVRRRQIQRPLTPCAGLARTGTKAPAVFAARPRRCPARVHRPRPSAPRSGPLGHPGQPGCRQSIRLRSGLSPARPQTPR